MGDHVVTCDTAQQLCCDQVLKVKVTNGIERLSLLLESRLTGYITKCNY